MKQLPKKRKRRGLLYFAAPAATLAAAAVLALAVFGAMNLPAYAKNNSHLEFASEDSAAFSDSDYLLADAPRAYGNETASDNGTTEAQKSFSAMSNGSGLAEELSASPVMVVWYSEEQAPFADLTPVMDIPLGEESGAALSGTLSALLPQSSGLAENITDVLCSAASNITLYLPAYSEMPELLDRCTGQYKVALYYPDGTPEPSDSFLLLAVTAP